MPPATLVVVDIQNDFCSGGALAVPDGESVIPIVNTLIREHEHLILTQDWHPPHHISFASRHPGHTAFTRMTLPYGTQVLWPDHCVAGTHGADFHPGLEIPPSVSVVRKGTHAEIDSYSAIYENDRQTPVGLDALLRKLGTREVVLAGLATDYCVLNTALDARSLGYEVTVIEAACRGIDQANSLAEAWNQMEAAGVRRA